METLEVSSEEKAYRRGKGTLRSIEQGPGRQLAAAEGREGLLGRMPGLRGPRLPIELPGGRGGRRGQAGLWQGRPAQRSPPQAKLVGHQMFQATAALQAAALRVLLYVPVSVGKTQVSTLESHVSGTRQCVRVLNRRACHEAGNTYVELPLQGTILHQNEEGRSRTRSLTMVT